MEIEVLRFSSGKDDTLGIMMIDGKFECFTLEDEYREEKVHSETRIPAGEYELGYIVYNTPLTRRYKRRFPWFKHHLHIKNVPNFKGIYIHVGNDEDDTAGCILVGDSCISNSKPDGRGFVGYSTDSYKRLYEKVSKVLDEGKIIKIKITDYA